MAALTLNGLTIPVAINTLKENALEGGKGSRASGAQWRDARTWLARQWTFETPPLDGDDADALALWIEGHGWHCYYDKTTLTDRGVGGENADGTITSAQSKFGGSSMILASNGTVEYVFNPTVPNAANFTLALWMRSDADGWTSFHHVVMRCTAGVWDYWHNGVAGARVAYNVSVSTSAPYWIVQITGKKLNGSTNTSTLYIDDLSAYPFALTDDMISALASATMANGPLPHLTMAGDVVPESTVDAVNFPIVRGEVTDVTYQQGVVGGTFRNNLRSLKVTLHEARATYGLTGRV